MNVLSMLLSHNDGSRDVDPNAISLMYSMYMFTNIGDSGDPVASP